MTLKLGDKLKYTGTVAAIWTTGNIYEVVYVWTGHLEGAYRVTSDGEHTPVLFNLKDWERV